MSNVAANQSFYDSPCYDRDGNDHDSGIQSTQGLPINDQDFMQATGDGSGDQVEAKQPGKGFKQRSYGDEYAVNAPLIASTDDDSVLDNAQLPAVCIAQVPRISPLRTYLSVFVLFLINLLNYMDRFTVAGVLLSIQEFFQVNNADAGLLQTVFIISYMIVAPIFGYLGDRYNRKVLMLVGMVVWSGCTLLASFVNNKDYFYLFLILRGLVGIGEASYSTIAPTIIADMFVKTKRTRMLSVFFFATPIGSGLGYIVGSEAEKLGGSWNWALRVTPALGLLTIILMLVIIPNPPRGASEATSKAKGVGRNRSSYLEDLKYILSNWTFIWVTIGFTCMSFVVGALALWGPVYVADSQVVSGALQPCTEDNCNYPGVSFTFGLITCLAGFMGVLIGAESAKKWRDRGNKNADAHVCAIGLIASSPFLYFGFNLASIYINIAWVCVFFGEMLLCFTWTLVTDMTLYVTLPVRRSTAQAVQILTMHLFGDAGSPYLIGVISDSIFAGMPNTFYSKYIALQRSFFITLFVTVIGGGGFLMAAVYLQKDKKKVDEYLAGERSSSLSTSQSSNDSTSTDSCYSSSRALRAPAFVAAPSEAKADEPKEFDPLNGTAGNKTSTAFEPNLSEPVTTAAPYLCIASSNNDVTVRDPADDASSCLKDKNSSIA